MKEGPYFSRRNSLIFLTEASKNDSYFLWFYKLDAIKVLFFQEIVVEVAKKCICSIIKEQTFKNS